LGIGAENHTAGSSSPGTAKLFSPTLLPYRLISENFLREVFLLPEFRKNNALTSRRMPTLTDCKQGSFVASLPHSALTSDRNIDYFRKIGYIRETT